MKKRIWTYIIAIAIPLAMGGLSALLTRNGMESYGMIIKPALSPPAWLFPIVWTALFILMGIGSALVYENSSGDERESALKIYFFQLAINFFWSIIFFNMRAYLFAFIWLLLLWVFIILMIIKFYRVNKAAALMQLPYLLWVTFAGYLTLSVWLLN